MALELQKLTVVKLKAMLKEQGLGTSGRKAELIERIVQHSEAVLGGAAAFRITGARGENADKINGDFVLFHDGVTRSKSKIRNGMPLYRKTNGGDQWLRMAKNRKWHVSGTKSKDRNSSRGFLVTKEKHLLSPDSARAWKVWNQGKWEEQASVSVMPFSLATWREEERKLQVQSYAGNRRSSAAIA